MFEPKARTGVVPFVARNPDGLFIRTQGLFECSSTNGTTPVGASRQRPLLEKGGEFDIRCYSNNDFLYSSGGVMLALRASKYAATSSTDLALKVMSFVRWPLRPMSTP